MFFGIKLVSTDDAVSQFLARFILQGYPGAKKNPVLIIGRLGHYIKIGQPFLQVMDAPVYAAQFFFSVDVL